MRHFMIVRFLEPQSVALFYRVPHISQRCGLQLLTFLSRCLEFISRLPADFFRQRHRFPPENESKLRHFGVTAEVHIWPVFIRWLMIAVRYKILHLLLAPFRIMAFKCRSLPDGKCRNAHARKAEVVRAIVVPGAGELVWLNGKMEVFCGLLHFRIESGALCSADVSRIRNTDRIQHVVVQVESDL